MIQLSKGYENHPVLTYFELLLSGLLPGCVTAKTTIEKQGFRAGVISRVEDTIFRRVGIRRENFSRTLREYRIGLIAIKVAIFNNF